MTDTERKPPSKESLMNVRGDTFLENYDKHDIAQAWLVSKLEGAGFDVRQHGEDNRHADEIQFGEGPDLAVFRDDTLCGFVEVKCKTSSEWFGKLNRRHFNHYLDHDEEHDVPTFIFFALLDEDREMIVRDGIIPVDSEDQIQGGFYAYGNEVVELDLDDTRNLQELYYCLNRGV